MKIKIQRECEIIPQYQLSAVFATQSFFHFAATISGTIWTISSSYSFYIIVSFYRLDKHFQSITNFEMLINEMDWYQCYSHIVK